MYNPLQLLKFLILPAMCLSIAGCVSQYKPKLPPRSDMASVKLAEAAVAASQSLENLEAIRKSENPEYAKSLPSMETPGMEDLATVDWTGPIEPLLRKLADATNYNLRVLGNRPEIPVIITIRAENTPLAEVLRNTDYQAGKKAYIKVYARSRTIELRYANTP